MTEVAENNFLQKRVTDTDIVTALADLIIVVEEIKTLEMEEISDPVSFTKAGSFLGHIKATIKQLETKRTEYKGPALEEGKRIDSKFKTYTKTLEELQKKVEKALEAWALAEIKKKQEAAVDRQE